MKRLFRVMLVLSAVLVLALVAAVVLLPKLAESEEVRRQLMAAGSEATGRDVAFGELDVALLPPGLRMTDARVSGVAESDPPFLEAATIDLRLSWLSLLSFSVVVDSLVVEGATLRMVRGEDGLVLPILETDTEGASPTEAPSASEAPAGSAEDEALSLAVRDVRLRETRVIFEDQTTEPPVLVEVSNLAGHAEGSLLPRRLDFDFSGGLSSGGSLRLHGHASADGEAEVKVDLSDVRIDPFAVYAPPTMGALAGSLSGEVAIEHAAQSGEADRLVFDLRLDEGDVALDDVTMRGALKASGVLRDPTGSPAGDFSIDATSAELRYAESFAKPVGTPARATGKLAAGSDGVVRIEGTKLKVDALEADVDAEVGDATEVEITAPAFELGSVARLFPDATSDKSVSGKAAFRKFVFRQTGDQFAFSGEAELAKLAIAGGDAPPVEISGVFAGSGNALASENLAVTVGKQVLPLALRLSELDTSPRFHVSGKAQDLDSQALLAALAGTDDKLSGPLDLDLDLRGPLSEEALGAMGGRVAFEVRPGQLRGVSLLESVGDQLGFLGQAALAVGEKEGGRSLKRLYGDEFEVLSGSFDIVRGIARTEDLQLIYREYDVKLRGAIALADLGLDMSGTLTLNEEAKEALGTGAEAKPKRVIPLAHVGGTANAPKVTVRADDALSIVRSVRPDKVEKLSDEIDERLGEGAGKQVLDALEGFLGGGRRN